MNSNSTVRSGAAILAVAMLVSGCITPPKEDPVLIKLDQIDRRVDSIERVVQNESLLEIAREIEQLRAEVRALRGQVETLQYESEGAATRQRDQYLDLDQRLQALERGTRPVAEVPADGAVAAAGAATGAATAAAGLPIPGGDDRQNYQAALELLKQGRYPQAESAFGEFLVAFPDSDLADNAQYWLGETFYVNRRFEPALAAFQVVLDKYPDSRKTPDALLKVGFCNYELKRWAEARAALEEVVSGFGDTTAARLAGQRLEKMSSEGH